MRKQELQRTHLSGFFPLEGGLFFLPVVCAFACIASVGTEALAGWHFDTAVAAAGWCFCGSNSASRTSSPSANCDCCGGRLGSKRTGVRLLRFSRGAGVDIRDLTRVGYLPFRLNVFLCAAILLTCLYCRTAAAPILSRDNAKFTQVVWYALSLAVEPRFDCWSIVRPGCGLQGSFVWLCSRSNFWKAQKFRYKNRRLVQK